METFANTIREERRHAFDDIMAGAELNAIGATLRIGIDSLETRLTGQLADAGTQEEVAESLLLAKDDATTISSQIVL